MHELEKLLLGMASSLAAKTPKDTNLKKGPSESPTGWRFVFAQKQFAARWSPPNVRPPPLSHPSQSPEKAPEPLLRGFWLKQPMKRSAAGIGIAAAVVVAAAAATRVAHAVIAAAAPDDDQQDDDPAAVSPTKAVIAHNRKPPMKT